MAQLLTQQAHPAGTDEQSEHDEQHSHDHLFANDRHDAAHHEGNSDQPQEEVHGGLYPELIDSDAASRQPGSPHVG